MDKKCDCMSEEEFNNLQVGDEVVVRSWGELVSDFSMFHGGKHIDVRGLLFLDEMKILCENIIKIKDFRERENKSLLVVADKYLFNRFMLLPKSYSENVEILTIPPIPFDDLL